MFAFRADIVQNFIHLRNLLSVLAHLCASAVRFPCVICVLIQLHERKSSSRSIFSCQCNIIQI